MQATHGSSSALWGAGADPAKNENQARPAGSGAVHARGGQAFWIAEESCQRRVGAIKQTLRAIAMQGNLSQAGELSAAGADLQFFRARRF